MYGETFGFSYFCHASRAYEGVEVLVAMYSVTPASARRRWTGEEGDEDLVFNCCSQMQARTRVKRHVYIVYDLYCGEGGFSRGARSVGCECYGFDINTACATRYETEPSCLDSPSSSCMTFFEADVSSPEFWDALVRGSLDGIDLPRPDLLHASPPCAMYARFVSPGLLVTDDMASDAVPGLLSINGLIERIKDFQQFLLATDGRPLIWQVENVPESRPFVQVPVISTSLLCGTTV